MRNDYQFILNRKTENSPKIIIIAGHYGTGKTNISVNSAMELSKYGKISIVDFDIVNPYFRTADNEEMLSENGINVILPEFANTNVDIPSLPKKLYSIFSDEGTAIIDVGGDDDGATALGVINSEIKESGYEMYFVYNYYRPMIRNAEDAYEMLKSIENVSGLEFCGIINNSNLGAETTPEDVLDSVDECNALSKLSGLPVIAVCALKKFSNKLDLLNNIWYINDITKKLY